MISQKSLKKGSQSNIDLSIDIWAFTIAGRASPLTLHPGHYQSPTFHGPGDAALQ